ncbi:hypothetical protein Tco_1293041 [Tanacetum coccineum]
MLMVDDNVGNQFRQNAVQNVGHLIGQNAVQNQGNQNVGNHNRLSVVPEIVNQHGNGNVVTARAEGNGNDINGNQIRCYNCRGEGHYASNYTVKPRKKDAAYLQTQLQIDQKEEAGIQLNSDEFDYMASAVAYDETDEVNANCTLKDNLQQASTSDTQTDKAPVYDSDRSAESREESYFSNTFKIATVSKLISIPNEEFSDDTTPTVAQKFLNEVKRTIVTLQRVVKQKITLDIHNWSSTAHQEIHKILKDEIFPIINQVDARLQNFEIQFLKEVAKFVQDFKSLANKADEYLDKQKTLELEIERLLRAVENEYVKLWNDWYKKCEECKYDKISYDKAHNDMQQKIERLQAQLGDLKGKCKDTACVSDTLDPLSQKLENENVKLEFQVVNYVREIEHLKTTYKNMFDSISVTRAQTKSIIDSLQDKLHDTIYENAKLRAQLFDKASEQKDTTKGTSANTKFANQSILGRLFLQPLRNNFFVRQPNAFQSERLKFSKNWVPPKVVKTNDLLNLVTSTSVPSTQESKVVNITKVIALGRFRINSTMNSRVDNFVPNKHVKASVMTKPIAVSQPHVITKNDINSKTNGFSPKDVKSTTRTRRPQPRNNPKNDKVPSKSKSSWLSNNIEKIEENHRNLQSSSNQKHMSYECNNIKLAIRNNKSEVICAMCKQCLITANHDVCVLNYVNGMNSHKRNQKSINQRTKNIMETMRVTFDELSAMMVCPIVNALASRILGAYDLGVATPRALVYAGDKTSGDARSWYMISGDAKS